MHYRDGTEAKVGDRCRFQATQAKRDGTGFEQVMREGLVYQTSPGANSCNLQVAYPHLETTVTDGGPEVRIVKMATSYVTAGECELSR